MKQLKIESIPSGKHSTFRLLNCKFLPHALLFIFAAGSVLTGFGQSKRAGTEDGGAAANKDTIGINPFYSLQKFPNA